MRHGIIVGVTGSFGTGKSTVADMLARRGAVVIDADKMAHDTLRRSPVQRRLKRRFGSDVVTRSGQKTEVNKKLLAQRGFASKKSWDDLCRIIHPEVLRQTRKELKAVFRRRPDAVAVLDVPLLIESGMASWVDPLVVVKASRRTQLARLVRKGWLPAEAHRRLKWQMPLEKKVKLADVVIDNDGSRRSTESQVQRLWKSIKQEKKDG